MDPHVSISAMISIPSKNTESSQEGLKSNSKQNNNTIPQITNIDRAAMAMDDDCESKTTTTTATMATTTMSFPLPNSIPVQYSELPSDIIFGIWEYIGWHDIWCVGRLLNRFHFKTCIYALKSIQVQKPIAEEEKVKRILDFGVLEALERGVVGGRGLGEECKKTTSVSSSSIIASSSSSSVGVGGRKTKNMAEIESLLSHDSTLRKYYSCFDRKEKRLISPSSMCSSSASVSSSSFSLAELAAGK